MSAEAKILIIEPFYGGSHQVLVELLVEGLKEDGRSDEAQVFTMRAKKWHWKARTSALYFSETIPKNHHYEVLFASSVLNLAELLGLRPDLVPLKKILYFHENQLAYPVQEVKERDFQYGYNQVISCLAADVVVFNSQYNLDSFLGGLKGFFKLQPEYRPKGLREKIEPKAEVLYFPVPPIAVTATPPREYVGPLHIVWPHRWEHDKCPESMVRVLTRLVDKGLDLRVSIVGQAYSETCPELQNLRRDLGPKILHWGYLSRSDYTELLSTAHIALSTAKHEFFGVAMLEATQYGCFPLCPDRLVYPEIYPRECLYRAEEDLEQRLSLYCQDPQELQSAVQHLTIDLCRYSSEALLPSYMQLLER